MKDLRTPGSDTRLQRSQGPDGEIPTSSMADIAFLLIVFFLVAASFAATRGLDFALPEEQDSKLIDPVDSVLVEVRAGGALEVDGRAMVLEGLLDYLEPKLRQAPDKPVIVRPVEGASYGNAVDVLDELRSGKSRLGLATEIQITLPTWREVAMFWPS